jgi:hypothetical protein
VLVESVRKPEDPPADDQEFLYNELLTRPSRPSKYREAAGIFQTEISHSPQLVECLHVQSLADILPPHPSTAHRMIQATHRNDAHFTNQITEKISDFYEHEHIDCPTCHHASTYINSFDGHDTMAGNLTITSQRFRGSPSALIGFVWLPAR